MADYASMKMEALLLVFYSLRPEEWRHAAENWRAMAGGINQAQTDLDNAWKNTPVFHLNEPDINADTFHALDTNIALSQSSAKEWAGTAGEWPASSQEPESFAAKVAACLDATARIIEDNRPFVQAAAAAHAAASEEGKEVHRRRAALYVWNVANAVRDTFNGVPVPWRPYQGPLGQRPDSAGAGDPNAQAPGAGTAAPGGPGDLGAGDQPGETPAEKPKEPEAKDPLDEAAKIVKLAGDGIDLLGKPADVASKYVGLAQSLKDLLGAGGTGTEGLDPDSLIPDDVYTPDLPTLAGGAGTPPTFDPSALTSGGAGGLASSSGLAASATPVAGPGAGLGATGSVGAAPSLAGKATSGSAASGQQQSMPPMYPPMGGMGAGAGAGGGGRGDIKPGTAAARAGGFSLPAEQSESERWRRHGVQADLQGRTGDEHRSASAVPALRKRKGSARPARPTEQDVLDEELWRP